MNTPSKDENYFPRLNVCESSSDETNLSQQATPRVENISQHSAIGMLASEETYEVLRVTVLYLEGLASSSIPNARISAWVGFRSSFPSDSMTIASSNYSSYFLKEGNLLAVESDQVKWTPTNDESSSFSGIAFWDSVGTDARPTSHLEVSMSSPTLLQNNHEHDSIQLPDILEFHICIACETPIPDVEKDNTRNPKWSRTGSNTSWNNEIEEVHWYNNEDEEDSDTDVFDRIHTTSLDRQLHHGVAHMKVYRDPDDNSFASEGKIVHIPIRLIQSRQSPLTEINIPEHHAFLSEQATLSLQVEKVQLPKKSVTEQRHYVETTWSGGQECAPLSVKCNDDDSSNKDDDARDTSLAKHFRFDTIKSLISGRKTTDIPQNLANEEKQQSCKDESMCKIQEVLESSFKSMVDSKKLAVAMREQRAYEPISPDRNATPAEVSPIKQPKESFMNNSCELEPANYELVEKSDEINNMKDNHNSVAPPQKLHTNGLQSQHESHQQAVQITGSPKKSIVSRLFCGASVDLAEVMHHCDEDHVGVYVADSMSLSSINT
jgi:hypothetical protein